MRPARPRAGAGRGRPGKLLATSKPDTGRLEAQAMARVLKSGYFGMGPETRALEHELARHFGPGRTVLCVNSGTAALHLALAALGLGDGDEVLVPSLTYVASFQAVAMTGARPVACDVIPASGLMDLDDARRRLGPRTRAIMPVHFAGNPGDLDGINAFAARHGLRVVEDAAHAFGSTCADRQVGGFGDIACFSFDPIKNITCGQGGAVVTADPAVAARVAAMRNLGLEPTTAAEYEVRGTGWRYQMSDLMACVGRVQLARFDSAIRPARVALAGAYRARLENVGGVTMLSNQPGVVAHIVPIRVARERRDLVREALAAAGFETRIHYKPNHLHPAFADGKPRPVAEALYAELITLPTHAGVDERHVEAIARVLERHVGPNPGGESVAR